MSAALWRASCPRSWFVAFARAGFAPADVNGGSLVTVLSAAGSPRPALSVPGRWLRPPGAFCRGGFQTRPGDLCLFVPQVPGCLSLRGFCVRRPLWRTSLPLCFLASLLPFCSCLPPSRGLCGRFTEKNRCPCVAIMLISSPFLVNSLVSKGLASEFPPIDR